MIDKYSGHKHIFIYIYIYIDIRRFYLSFQFKVRWIDYNTSSNTTTPHMFNKLGIHGIRSPLTKIAVSFWINRMNTNFSRNELLQILQKKKKKRKTADDDRKKCKKMNTLTESSIGA